MDTVFVMQANVPAAEHISWHSEIFIRDVRHAEGNVTLSTNQPELPSTHVYELIPALTFLEDRCGYSTVCVQVY